jgi:cobalt/nickel transport system permease protein
VPAGLQRLSNLWTAPFPAYAPSFIRSRSFGYLLSAMFGVGVLLCASLLAQRVLERRRGSPA